MHSEVTMFCLQLIGLFLVFLLYYKHRKFMNFIGGAIPIVFYIAYFLALLLVEYIFMGKDSFVKCQNPWKNVTDDEVNKICLSGMTSDKIPIREDEPISKGNPLRPAAYDYLIEHHILQGFILIIPFYLFTKTVLGQTISSIWMGLFLSKRIHGDYNNPGLWIILRSEFRNGSKFAGVTITLFEISSFLITLGLLFFNGNLFQTQWSIGWDTWTSGFKVVDSLDGHEIFPSIFPCPVSDEMKEANGDKDGPYFYCRLEYMRVYELFYMFYWTFLTFYAAELAKRCFFRIMLILSQDFREFYLSVVLGLHKFCSGNKDKFASLQHLLCSSHSRFVLTASIMETLDEEQTDVFFKHVYRFNRKTR